jgi:hypothetical protein
MAAEAEYTGCLARCIPRDFETKIVACETRCSRQKNWQVCIKRCVPKDVDEKVESCGLECEPKQPHLKEETVEGIMRILIHREKLFLSHRVLCASVFSFLEQFLLR